MNRLLVVLLLIAFTECQSDSRESNNNAKETQLSEFDVYLNSLDTIPLPFEYWSKDELQDLSVNYNKALYSKYKSKLGSKPYGILFRTPVYSVVIDCVQGTRSCLPNIISYDSSGFPIDSIPEITSRFGIYFEDHENNEYLKVNSQGKVTLIDEGIGLIIVDSNGREIGQETKIDSIVYDLKSDGRFQRNHRESGGMPID